MKRISFFLALVLTVCSFGLANAQNTIDATIGGLFNKDTVGVGGTISIQMSWNVDAGINTKITGFTNAFKVSGSATWDTVTNNYDPAFPNANFDGGTFKPVWNMDGMANDTISFGGFTIFGPGAEPGFSGPAYLVDIINVQGADGDEICFDTVTSYPSGSWKWTDLSNDIFPVLQWDNGSAVVNPPFCWTLYQIPDQPPVAHPTDLTVEGEHCDVFENQITSTDVDGCTGSVTYEMVSGPGSVDASSGLWSWNPTCEDAGMYEVQIRACCPATNCGTTVGQYAVFNVTVNNAAPEIVCPTTTKVGQTGNDLVVCFEATDVCPGDAITWSVGNLPAGATESWDQLLGCLTINFADEYLGTLEIIATDQCGEADTCSKAFNVSAGAPYAVDIEDVECGEGEGVIQGTFVDVDVNLTAAADAIGAFDLLIAYDASALSFSEATTENSALYNECGWEYFTYRLGADGNCSGGCPSGIVRAVGFAETNAPGTADMECTDAAAPVTLFTMSFLVTSDLTFECQQVPIRFFWLDCGDNTLSNWDGTQLFVSAGVFNGDVNMAADVGFPSYVGAPNSCLDGYKVEAQRFVDFFNGAVCIICTGDIDDRGDINLDGIPYTVADAVMLTNYLLIGPTAFPNFNASYVASDVNADGLAASVADLVYLVRVIVGDAQPYAPSGFGKISPVTAELQRAGGVLSMEDVEVSGMHLVLAGDVEATLLADNLTMQTHFDGTNTSVVITTPVDADQIYSAQGALVDIGSAEIVSMDIATSQGAPVHSNVNVLPTAYELSQNYPNPFNPTTTISFSLPVASDYSLKIYNITGQLVKEFNGSAAAGIQTVEVDMSTLASGVYFYKLDAGNFTDTKKMVMLK